MPVDGANADEVAVWVGDHEGAAEHVVVGLLDHPDALGDPLLVDLVDGVAPAGQHQSELAGARRLQSGVFVVAGPDREQDAGRDLESDIAGAGEGGLDVEQVAVEHGGTLSVGHVGQEQVGCRHGGPPRVGLACERLPAHRRYTTVPVIFFL